jgi:heat shock protein HtpX
MSGETLDVLERRIANLRIAAGVVLAGFMLNAVLAIFLIAWMGASLQITFFALLAMAVVVAVAALYGDTFLTRATGARPLSRDEFPWLIPMVAALAQRAGIPAPTVLVADQDVFNAYTAGRDGRAKIVFFRGLLQQMPPDQVRAVAAHEIGHVVNRDVPLAVWAEAIFAWVTVVTMVVSIVASLIKGFSEALPKAMGDEPLALLFAIPVALVGFVIAGTVWFVGQAWKFLAGLMQLALTRQREFLADATAVALTGQPGVFADALATLEAYPAAMQGAARVRRFCIVAPLVQNRWSGDLFSTHPSTVRRIEEVLKLPPVAVSLQEKEWKGLGSVAMFIPAATIFGFAVVVLAIPLLR